MFDYKKFEDAVAQQMAAVFDRWTREHDDLYIFSLDCAGELDSIGVIANTTHYLEEQTEANAEAYWYYKYCEEEWDLFETFTAISADMRKFLDENSDRFTDHATHEYAEAFDEHCGQIIACCQNALIRFRQSIGQDHQTILLTFHMRDYLDEEERIQIFEKINSENAFKEYVEHIDEFA